MVLSLYGPSRSGVPRIFSGEVRTARRIRTSGGVFGAFAFNAEGVGYFPECRLIQYRRGGFFASGEWLLDANERTYPQFVEFLEPFTTWLARAARIEIVSHIREEQADLLPEDEPLDLAEDELKDRAEPAEMSMDDVVRIVRPKQKGRLVGRRAQFDAIIGDSIRVRGCRLTGRRGFATLVLPTSEGLKLRPINLDHHLVLEIIRRAEAFGVEPEPYAA